MEARDPPDTANRSNKLDLSIIVVNYNTRRLTEECITSIERHLTGRIDFETILVDNASTDGTPEWLRGFAPDHPRLVPVYSPENLGFSGGNNAGLALATGRHILFLNSDAFLIDDSVVEMIAYLDANPRVGLGAAMLLTGDGKPGPSYGHFPTAGILAKELLFAGNTSLRAVCPPLDAGDFTVDFPCGAFFLIRGDLVKSLKGMDTAYFMYFEETDLARRARDLGFECRYFGNGRAVHLGGQSSREVKSLFLTRMFYTNWKRFLHKHHHPISAFLVRMMLGSYLMANLWKYRLKGDAQMITYFSSHLQALSEGWREFQ